MLYLFDLDGTLIEGFLTEVPCDPCGGTGKAPPLLGDRPAELRRDCLPCKGRGYIFGEPLPYERVAVLPGRVEKIQDLTDAGHTLAIVTNQGGVAFGHQTEVEVNEKLHRALTALNFRRDAVYVCLAHPEATVEKYREGAARRKPSPSMLNEAMNEYGYAPHETTFVGDMDSDREAAVAANVTYIDAEEFFNGE